ncbi:hypothetical protein MMC26_001219 [Xylographa opegraphella]|nr:hypothetical protein [Xylographa opegraphella]
MSFGRYRMQGLRRFVNSVRPSSQKNYAHVASTMNGFDRTAARGRTTEKIHILGLGNVGCFVAHSLKSIQSETSIVLLLHRKDLLGNWKNRAESIDLQTDGVSEIRGGFDAELVVPLSEGEDMTNSSVSNHEPIHNLIVAVKAQNTVSAMRSIQHLLTAESTVLFLQNGMGVTDEVNTRLFPSQAGRPKYMIGINSHGLNGTGPFVITYAGNGSIKIGTGSPEQQDTSSGYLQQSMLQAKALNTVLCSPDEVLQLQWEKLAANLVVNPLTAVLDCPNGRLTDPDMEGVISALTTEIAAVIQALPEMSASTKAYFLPDRLQALVITISTKTAKNVSSMLQDVRSGKDTEIAYITGYLLRRAEELGIRCQENEKLMRKVLLKLEQLRIGEPP